jgi:hypothetical protein
MVRIEALPNLTYTGTYIDLPIIYWDIHTHVNYVYTGYILHTSIPECMHACILLFGYIHI